MSYFSQRKKEKRENLLLAVALFLLAVATLSAFFYSSSSPIICYLNNWRFQIYLLIIAVLLYSLVIGRVFYSLLAIVLLGVNYIVIASEANIFFDSQVKDEHQLKIMYQNNARNLASVLRHGEESGAAIISLNYNRPVSLNPAADSHYRYYHNDDNLVRSVIFTDLRPLRAGKINLTPGRQASFISFEENKQKFMVINIDFNNLQPEETKAAFKNLQEFILSQDNPLIVIGDFGIPAWSSVFKKFLHHTDLEVKNGIILSNGKSRFNPFLVPTFNVLAYGNVGIEKIEFLSKGRNSEYPLLIELGYY